MAMQTPQQLTARAIAGSWLVFLMVPLILLLRHTLKVPDGLTGAPYALALLWRLSIMLVPLVGGSALVYISEAKLKKGIAAQCWETKQLTATRNSLERPALRFVTYSIALAALAWVLGIFLHQHSLFRMDGAFAYALATPGFTLARLKQSLNPPASAQLTPDWSKVKPLHSAQWGQHSWPASTQTPGSSS